VRSDGPTGWPIAGNYACDVSTGDAHELPLVLIAEDDRATRESLTLALELEGYRVRAVVDGVEALAAVTSEHPAAIVIDVMMPRMDGLSVCRRLRVRGDRTPVLILTARTEVSDRVSGLDAGADDYLAKPFSLEELLARVRALLRRSGIERDGGTLQVCDLRVDPPARRAWRGERELDLTKTEFDLLEVLAQNTGLVLDHATIYDRIWGYDFGPDSKNLAVYVGYLRRKLEQNGEPRLLHTVRGVGYTLREP
jgi:two-component system response regulator MprA